ncbi:hypothetical protein KC207_15805 [Phycicoccus sp. BSK3Z-2]|uniref:Uncharacterized protein n=1 Tax=Phycicoccus avicenniae TaxID=2828860 RepID=A0A941DEC7_9MICO|nr:hypothetical protein [Phycicoccus avicenniae]MBR7744762.1 hypothetical protein [Phycicoccus avicenniae]
MTTDVDALVRLFAERLRSQGVPVEAAATGSRTLHIEHGGERLVILLPERELSRLLADGDELARDLWPGTSALEAAARMLTVHLEESLEPSTRGSTERTWTYRAGFFEKV